MRNSSTRKKASKPRKPRPDFPLFPHASGRWAKKVRGQFCYFGKVADDPEGEAALKRWLDEKDYLLAGRTPPPNPEDVFTLHKLCNAFMAHKDDMQASGELAPRPFAGYKPTSAFTLAVRGKGRAADDVRPEDFQKLRAAMAKKWGPVKLGNEIQTVRSVFRFGFESGLLALPVRFGPAFKKPSAKTLRQTRAANGPRMFTAGQVHALLAHANRNLRAMILLGLQAGFGNTDVAELPIRALDLESGWLDYARVKTGMPRRVPLWPETVAALQAVLDAHPGDSDLLFIGPRGVDYTGNHRGYRVAAEFNRARKAAGIEGRSFYDLRRTFQTVAEGAHDLVAVQSIMGHAPSSGDMSAVYRQRIDDDRLRAVVEHVRQWWLAGKPKQQKTST